MKPNNRQTRRRNARVRQPIDGKVFTVGMRVMALGSATIEYYCIATMYITINVLSYLYL